MRRFKAFTDNEVYILSRMAMESSFEITCTGNYNKFQAELACDLLNELIKERRIRNM